MARKQSLRDKALVQIQAEGQQISKELEVAIIEILHRYGINVDDYSSIGVIPFFPGLPHSGSFKIRIEVSPTEGFSNKFDY